MHNDDVNQKLYEKKERQKLKSGVPTELRNIDPVKDAGRWHEAGKGSKIRDIEGWYSEEVTKTLEKIFGKKKKQKKEKVKIKHDESTPG